jgi:hypothetical protein
MIIITYHASRARLINEVSPSLLYRWAGNKGLQILWQFSEIGGKREHRACARSFGGDAPQEFCQPKRGLIE